MISTLSVISKSSIFSSTLLSLLLLSLFLLSLLLLSLPALSLVCLLSDALSLSSEEAVTLSDFNAVASEDFVSEDDVSEVVVSLSLSASSLASFSLSFRLSRSRSSFSPGIPNPRTIFLLPSLIIFPLSIVTFEKLSPGRIIPVIMTKGVFMVSVLSPTFVCTLVLFVYWILMVSFPLLPARSFGAISFPSR